MAIEILEIPDSHEERVEWLEGHLLDVNLSTLVLQLAAVHQRNAKDQWLASVAVQKISDEQWNNAIEFGLSVLSPEEMKELLTNPKLLYRLQEDVCTRGGEYWLSHSARTATVDQLSQQHWLSIAGSLATQNDGDTHANSIIAKDIPRHARQPTIQQSPVQIQVRRVSFLKIASVVFASAAIVLLLVSLSAALIRNRELEGMANNWGWQRDEFNSADIVAVTPSAYLNQLADEADDWFLGRPNDPKELAQRINEFRHGCSLLIMATHPQLDQPDREWLVGKCRDWALKLDQALASLEQGNSTEVVREEVDTIVRKLTDAIRTRSSDLA